MPKKPEIHMVLDLETLGDTPTAVLFEAGVAAVDVSNLNSRIYAESFVLRLADAMMDGDVSASTLEWWLSDASIRQPARDRLAKIWGQKDGLRPMQSMRYLLDGINNFWNRHKPVAVWAMGATFDFPILNDKYARHEMRAPWSFRDQLCARPLRRIFPAEYKIAHDEANLLSSEPDFPGGGVHAADYDCVVVAMFLRNVNRQMRALGRTLQGPIE